MRERAVGSWRRSGPAVFVAVGAAYLALSQLVVWLTDPAATWAGLWPAAGVALGSLLLVPPRSWGWVLAAVALAEIGGSLSRGYPFALSVGWALDNVVEALVGALLLRRFGNPRGLLSPVPDLLRFILLGVVVAPAVGTTIGAVTTVLGFGTALVDVWPRYFVGDALGVLVVAPVVLTLHSHTRHGRTRKEAAALVGVSLATCAAVFVDWAGAWMSTMPYLLMPCLSWAALRFGARGVAWLSLAITLMGTFATAYGEGPFARAGGATGQSVTMFQVFVTISVVSALLLAALAEQVVEQRDMGARWRHQARHDPLTGLVNRAGLEELLDEVVTAASHPHRPLTVVMCDVDRLKEVNDTYGHPAGDELLRAVAARLQAAVRPDDVVARISGDEFVLVLEGADAGQGKVVAERVLSSVRRPLTLGEGEVIVPSLSIGIALQRSDDRAADLLSRADQSMYESKARGRDRPATAMVASESSR